MTELPEQNAAMTSQEQPGLDSSAAQTGRLESTDATALGLDPLDFEDEPPEFSEEDLRAQRAYDAEEAMLEEQVDRAVRMSELGEDYTVEEMTSMGVDIDDLESSGIVS